MGISGTWVQRAAHDYTGATKWGNGVNPIHGVRDNGRGRVIGVRENLLPLGEPSDVVQEALTARDIDYVCEDYADVPYPGEVFRYQEEMPRFDTSTPQFRDAVNSPAMGEHVPWGVYFDSDPTGLHPLPGPTGGMLTALDVDHGEIVEQQRAIAVPTSPVSGGWLSKVRAKVAQPESQEATQEGFVWTLNNASVQGPGLRELANDRAVLRGTDAPRSGILSRTAGMVEKTYAKSFGMGGGAGTPDMQPFQQTAGLKRPFLTRKAATPPMELHTWGGIESRSPLTRTTPADPYQGDPEVAGGAVVDTADWGY